MNIISEPWVNNANICAIDAPPEVDEWLVSGLTKEPSVRSFFSKMCADSPNIHAAVLDASETGESQGERVQHGMRGVFVLFTRES